MVSGCGAPRCAAANGPRQHGRPSRGVDGEGSARRAPRRRSRRAPRSRGCRAASGRGRRRARSRAADGHGRGALAHEQLQPDPEHADGGRGPRRRRQPRLCQREGKKSEGEDDANIARERGAAGRAVGRSPSDVGAERVAWRCSFFLARVAAAGGRGTAAAAAGLLGDSASARFSASSWAWQQGDLLGVARWRRRAGRWQPRVICSSDCLAAAASLRLASSSATRGAGLAGRRARAPWPGCEAVVDEEAGQAADHDHQRGAADEHVAQLLLRVVLLDGLERALVVLLGGHRLEAGLLLGLEPRLLDLGVADGLRAGPRPLRGRASSSRRRRSSSERMRASSASPGQRARRPSGPSPGGVRSGPLFSASS